jgi:hypothetical protein
MNKRLVTLVGFGQVDRQKDLDESIAGLLSETPPPDLDRLQAGSRGVAAPPGRFEIDIGESGPSQMICRIAFNRSFQRLDRALEASQIVVRRSESEVGKRSGAKAQGSLRRLECFRVLPHFVVKQGEIVMGNSIVWRQLDDLQELVLGLSVSAVP